jgi:hypothetical protein
MRLSLVFFIVLGSVLIVFGVDKLLTHYFSIWRAAPLDYILGVIGVTSGVFLLFPFSTLTRFRTGVISLTATALAVSFVKIRLDYRDGPDVSFSLLIILAGTILLLKLGAVSKSESNERQS